MAQRYSSGLQNHHLGVRIPPPLPTHSIVVNRELETEPYSDGKEYGEGIGKDYTLPSTDPGAVASPSTDVRAVLVFNG